MFVVFDSDDAVIAFTHDEEVAQRSANFLGPTYWYAKISEIQGQFTAYKAELFKGTVSCHQYRTLFNLAGQVKVTDSYVRVWGSTEEEARRLLDEASAVHQPDRVPEVEDGS